MTKFEVAIQLELKRQKNKIATSVKSEVLKAFVYLRMNPSLFNNLFQRAILNFIFVLLH